MKIDYNISYKDALFLAKDLISQNDMLKELLNNSVKTAYDNKEDEFDYDGTAYQIVFNLCEIADYICEEVSGRENRKSKN